MTTEPPERSTYLQRALYVLAFALLAIGGYGLWQKYYAVVEPPTVDLDKLDPEIVEAITARRKAVQEQPRSAEAWGQLGAVLRAHRLRSSNVCFAQAQKLDPKDYRWPYLIGIDPPNPDAAVAYLRRAAELSLDDPVPRLRLGEVLLDRGQVDEAEALFRGSLEAKPPHDARAHLGLGRIALERGDVGRAVDHLRRAVDGAPGAKAVHVALAQAYHRQGNVQAAAEEQRRAALLTDSDSGWPDPGAEFIERAWVGLSARMRRINLMDVRGLREEAVVAARQAVSRYPESALARLVLGEMLNKSKNVAAAEVVLREAIRMDPERDKAHFELGFALHAQGKVREAVESYRRVIAARPDFAPAHFNLALALVALKDEAGAFEELQAAVRFGPNHSDAHRALSAMLEGRGRHKEALAHAELAVRLSPSDGQAQHLLATLRAKDAKR